MTPLEALEIQEQRLRSIVELAPACLARVTRDASILAMNGAARNMLGASEAREVLKKSLLAFATTDDRERLRTFVEQGCDGKSASLELSMVSLAGDAREIEASVVALPARGDASPTALLTFRDVSGYRRLEDSVIETARLEAEKAAREAADRAREAELARVRGEADNAAHVAAALREAAIRDAARLEELEGRLTELGAECRQLASDRDAQAAAVHAARAEAQAADRDRDELRRRLDESLTKAESDRAQLARELDSHRVAEVGRQQEEVGRQREAIARQGEEIGRLQEEIARLHDVQLATERAEADRVRQDHALEEQRRDSADYDRLLADRDELKRNFDSVSAAHATEMAMAFADRAALERRVKDTDLKQRRLEAEIARVTAERDGAARSLAESQQHEQQARRWIARWIELERAMQIARADLQELADWAHGRNGHSSAAEPPVARPLPGAASHHTSGDAPWN